MFVMVVSKREASDDRRGGKIRDEGKRNDQLPRRHRGGIGGRRSSTTTTEGVGRYPKSSAVFDDDDEARATAMCFEFGKETEKKRQKPFVDLVGWPIISLSFSFRGMAQYQLRPQSRENDLEAGDGGRKRERERRWV